MMFSRLSIRSKILLINMGVALLCTTVLMLLLGMLWANTGMLNEQVASNARQDTLSLEQHRLIKNQSTLLDDQLRLQQERDQVDEMLGLARKASTQCLAMSYWLTDLALSMQEEAEREGKAQVLALNQTLDRLQTTDPATVAKVKPLVAGFEKMMLEAADSYADDNRVMGNAKASLAHAQSSSALDALDLMGRRLQARAAEIGSQLTTINQRVKQAGTQVLDASREMDVARLAVGTATNHIVSANQQLRIWTLGGTLVELLFSVLISIWLARSIARSVGDAELALATVTEQIHGASCQASSSSQMLAQGASEQASSLEETSATLEELAAGTRQNAGHAHQADALAKEVQRTSATGEVEARKVAAEVARQMAALAEAVLAIRSATDRTATVVETIDEIAFQTNLLALNAAVEAARAGDAGAGFAIVADEVRALAQRSAEEVRSSTALMQEAKAATERVQRSSAQIDAYLAKAVGEDVVQAFQAVVASTNRVSQLMTEVATATDKQAKGIGQVNAAVTEIDKVTQSNSAVAEQSAAASEELTNQAAELRSLVNTLNRIIRGDTAANQAQAAAPGHHGGPANRTTQAPTLVTHQFAPHPTTSSQRTNRLAP